MKIEKGLEENRLAKFLDEYGDSSSKLQVLLFWGKHPRAKFSLYCIADALDARRLDLKEAVEQLVASGVLEEQKDSNGVAWYCATPQKRECFEILAGIGRSEIGHRRVCDAGKLVTANI